jgi:organic hydroperoxide reductase OsmC/OhrA
MVKYPLAFKATAESTSGVQSIWRASVGLDQEPLTCAIPPEFEGPGGGYSPEDFFVLAAANCFVATFRVIAERSKLEFSQIMVKADLTVDRDPAGRPWMSAVVLNIELKGAADRERALRLLQKTSESCIVLHSIRSEKRFEFSVH